MLYGYRLVGDVRVPRIPVFLDTLQLKVHVLANPYHFILVLLFLFFIEVVLTHAGIPPSQLESVRLGEDIVDVSGEGGDEKLLLSPSDLDNDRFIRLCSKGHF